MCSLLGKMCKELGKDVQRTWEGCVDNVQFVGKDVWRIWEGCVEND